MREENVDRLLLIILHSIKPFKAICLISFFPWTDSRQEREERKLSQFVRILKILMMIIIIDSFLFLCTMFDVSFFFYSYIQMTMMINH